MKSYRLCAWLVVLLSVTAPPSFDAGRDALPSPTRYASSDDHAKRFMTTASDSVLTLLNANLWLLPGGFAVDKEARIARFVAYARHLWPHVITLQEVWTTNQVAYLKRRFPEYAVFASGGRGPVNEGGLVTLTRLPSDSAGFSAFAPGRGASLVERQARKGYLTVRLATPAFKTCIINTHLYSPGNPRELALTAAQFETLRRLRPAGDYVIVGDLNLAQSAFDRLNGAFFLTEEDTAHTVDPGNRYRRKGLSASRRQKSLKSDRLLIPRAQAWRFALRSVLIREPLVSDHYVLGYRLELQEPPLARHLGEALDALR